MSEVTHLPDIHELGESKAESFIEGEGLKCLACGKVFKYNETTWFSSGPSPYAAPICKECYWEDYD